VTAAFALLVKRSSSSPSSNKPANWLFGLTGGAVDKATGAFATAAAGLENPPKRGSSPSSPNKSPPSPFFTAVTVAAGFDGTVVAAFVVSFGAKMSRSSSSPPNRSLVFDFFTSVVAMGCLVTGAGVSENREENFCDARLPASVSFVGCVTGGPLETGDTSSKSPPSPNKSEAPIERTTDLCLSTFFEVELLGKKGSELSLVSASPNKSPNASAFFDAG
jgi:hypothetical protein